MILGCGKFLAEHSPQGIFALITDFAAATFGLLVKLLTLLASPHLSAGKFLNDFLNGLLVPLVFLQSRAH